jgi:histone-lysine N-methyltransferase SETMAR
MLTVIWRINGFHVVDLMTEQHSYNTQYFLSHILETLLLAVFPDGHKPHSCRLSLHLGNCRVHRSKASAYLFAENPIIRVPHPLYSPELAPSDFWLFGHMNVALGGQRFPGPEDLLVGIHEFLSEVQRSELELVFHHWIERFFTEFSSIFFHSSLTDGSIPLRVLSPTPAC